MLPFTAGAPRPAASISTATPVVDLARTLTFDDVDIAALGRCLLPSPVAAHLGEKAMHFVGKADRVLVNDHASDLVTELPVDHWPSFELAGPRNKIFFDPRTVRCGIVTCGSLCPGLGGGCDPRRQSRSIGCGSRHRWHMARNAVHAAMAGNTCMLIGRWHGRFVHVPMNLATRARKQVDPAGDLWMSVIEATGQPLSWLT
jgi:hypothetical protein